MGQRSQIYVRFNKELIIANYYQWNFGERMISRAKYGLDYIKYYVDNGYTWYLGKSLNKYPRSDREKYSEKLRRYFDVNFDMQDIVLSSILEEEWKDFGKDTKFNDFIFGVDNNDGRLFIDITYDEESKKGQIKYCFTNCKNEKPMTPKQYMDWDYPNWEKSEYIEEDIKKATENNLEFIEKNFTLMTQEELEDYLNTDYTPKETTE